MAGNKTHDQQMRIIEKRENTRNADEDFDAGQDLDRSKEERDVRRRGDDLRTDAPDLTDPDDRAMLRGEGQESGHHKRRTDD